MSDRELLELAAKAAGYVIELDMNWGTGGMPFFRMSGNKWNPLADDGDALRLAVKLGLASSSGTQVYTADDDLMAAWADRDSLYGTDLHQQVQWSRSHGDPYTATRRAIVRAAAAIGKAMK